MTRERAGLAGLVQCEGCPDTNMVPELIGVCTRHDRRPVQDYDYFETYDVVGNL